MSCAIEYKTCPRCHAPFECRVGFISTCQCSTVELNGAERNYISEHYDDCLCVRCMLEMKTEYVKASSKQDQLSKDAN